MVVAIDGPAGVGKTTTAKILADKLGFMYLDTGAMYRSMTYLFLQRNVDLNDREDVNKNIILFENNVEFKIQNPMKIYLFKKDISQEIRKVDVTNFVSQVSAIDDVRKSMVKIQRSVATKGNVVVEGRDIGTVVFPDAKFKFFLTAEYEVRALRRLKEFNNMNENINVNQIKEDLLTRDNYDSNRKISPLKKAEDAFEIDTTNCSIDEQVSVIFQEIEKRNE
ncbi:MAG: (d)CMP kinase [Pelagibacteraceae bacterium]